MQIAQKPNMLVTEEQNSKFFNFIVIYDKGRDSRPFFLLNCTVVLSVYSLTEDEFN